MEPRPSVVIAEDEALIRETIRLMLGREFEVLAALGDGRAAVAAAKKHRPDIVLLDISMPGINGFQAAQQIAECCPDVKVLMMTCHGEPDYIDEAFRRGARGWVEKSRAVTQLPHAIHAVLAGEQYRPGDELEKKFYCASANSK